MASGRAKISIVSAWRKGDAGNISIGIAALRIGSARGKELPWNYWRYGIKRMITKRFMKPNKAAGRYSAQIVSSAIVDILVMLTFYNK
jgi:hypothetical protein